MSIEDRDWYREHIKAKRTPVAAAPKPPAKRRNPHTRQSKLYWTLILFMILSAIVSQAPNLLSHF